MGSHNFKIDVVVAAVRVAAVVVMAAAVRVAA
jgi:hypothetical protein